MVYGSVCQRILGKLSSLIFNARDTVFDFAFLLKHLTLFTTHAHLAVLGIEGTACVTILDRIKRRPPSVERFSHGAGSVATQAYRANDKLARSGRANDKLARSGRALSGAARQ